mmetsp:Transcript_8033/g.20081  ORF Transcript_8033/g.20081 Transcript_8033/m.20081 type:complete len:94 (-) Transcript_8033:54-335(-)
MLLKPVTKAMNLVKQRREVQRLRVHCGQDPEEAHQGGEANGEDVWLSEKHTSLPRGALANFARSVSITSRNFFFCEPCVCNHFASLYTRSASW